MMSKKKKAKNKGRRKEGRGRKVDAREKGEIRLRRIRLVIKKM